MLDTTGSFTVSVWAKLNAASTAAVQDPAQPHQINPAYLTGGVPNAAYHDAIAQVIADAASRFPPEAQL